MVRCVEVSLAKKAHIYFVSHTHNSSLEDHLPTTTLLKRPPPHNHLPQKTTSPQPPSSKDHLPTTTLLKRPPSHNHPPQKTTSPQPPSSKDHLLTTTLLSTSASHLLGLESEFDEDLLQLLVDVVDAELLKAVLLEDLEAVNV